MSKYKAGSLKKRVSDKKYCEGYDKIDWKKSNKSKDK